VKRRVSLLLPRLRQFAALMSSADGDGDSVLGDGGEEEQPQLQRLGDVVRAARVR
jgi:hypothetical protein